MREALRRHEEEQKSPLPPARKPPLRPEDIPPLGRALRSEQFCIRCHMVHDHQYKAHREAGTWKKDMLWRYPPPDNVGLVMDVNEGNAVAKVTAGSAAAKAGVKPGDVIRKAGPTEVLTYTDLQWALDRTPATARLPLILDRGGKREETTLELSGDWRRSELIWRKSFLALEPQSGAWVHEVEEERRSALGLPAKGLALEIFFVDSATPAHAAGLKVRDVVTAVDGKTDVMTRHQFRAYWPATHDPGGTGTLEIVRGGKPMTVTLKF